MYTWSKSCLERRRSVPADEILPVAEIRAGFEDALRESRNCRGTVEILKMAVSCAGRLGKLVPPALPVISEAATGLAFEDLQQIRVLFRKKRQHR